jgi:hypothetical protein
MKKFMVMAMSFLLIYLLCSVTMLNNIRTKASVKFKEQTMTAQSKRATSG